MRKLGTDRRRSLVNWAVDFIIVVAGVLLALWLAELAEERREARVRAETLERVDEVIRRTVAMGISRIATAGCYRDRLAELDRALQSSSDDWKGNPLPNLPESMTRNSPFRFAYLADQLSVPHEVFDLAESSGTFAALPPDTRELYAGMRQDVLWMSDAWQHYERENISALTLLGVDGKLDRAARFEMRKRLADMGVENQITIARTRSLHRQMKEAGLELGPSDIARIRESVAFMNDIYGGCAEDIDPQTLEPRGAAN